MHLNQFRVDWSYVKESHKFSWPNWFSHAIFFNSKNQCTTGCGSFRLPNRIVSLDLQQVHFEKNREKSIAKRNVFVNRIKSTILRFSFKRIYQRSFSHVIESRFGNHKVWELATEENEVHEKLPKCWIEIKENNLLSQFTILDLRNFLSILGLGLRVQVKWVCNVFTENHWRYH